VLLETDQKVIALIVADGGMVLSVTENGFGKRTPVDEFPLHGRGGKGVISIRTSDRNGAQVGAVLVQPEDEIMLITDGGTLVRTPVHDISILGRDTQGVKLISLGEGEKLVGIDRVVSLGVDETEGPDLGEPTSDELAERAPEGDSPNE
jgi:DNA gyrase subunit A